MSGSREPGPQGLDPGVGNIDDGTMVRMLSPRPGPLHGPKAAVAGFDGGFPRNTPFVTGSPGGTAQARIPVLRQGSQGGDVQKLQRQLNARLAPSPGLVVDGQFGPRTEEAVLQYQRGVSLVADGVVGKQTWYHLLKGDKATGLQASLSAAPSSMGGSTMPALGPAAVLPYSMASASVTAARVWELPMEEKFARVLRRTVSRLPGSMQHEFETLLSPASLAIMAGTLVIWAASHAFGVGEVIDILLLLGGVFFLGMAVFDVAAELGDFLVLASTAADEGDLDKAASHLARAIAILGIAAFIALLAKVARAKGSKAGPAGKPPSPLQSEASPQAVRAKPPSATPSSAAQAQRQSGRVEKNPPAPAEPTGTIGKGEKKAAPPIEEGKQGKHVPGHNNFQEGKSELTHPAPQGLVDRHAGTGQQVGATPNGQPGAKERVDFGTIIGNYVDPVTGAKSPTTNGIIHQSSKGVHIVPSRPNP